MTIANADHEIGPDASRRSSDRRWLVNLVYVTVTLGLLAWGVYSFAVVTRRDLIGYAMGEDPRSTLLGGQLRLLMDCLFCLIVTCAFLHRTLRQRLSPRLATAMATVSVMLAAAMVFFAGFLLLAGGIGLEENETYPALWAAGMGLAWSAIPIVTAAATLAVRLSLGNTPSWKPTVGIVIACLVGINITCIIAGSPQIG